MWRDRAVDCIGVCTLRPTDMDVRIAQVELGVDVRLSAATHRHALVRPHNIFQVHIDKVVERVNVLLDQALDLEERGEERPLVLDLLNGVREAFALALGTLDHTLHAPKSWWSAANTRDGN